MNIRPATTDDLPFLERMWDTAAFWQPGRVAPEPEVAMRIPEIARYIAGWGREGDVALVVFDGDEPLGASWYRIFPASEPGC